MMNEIEPYVMGVKFYVQSPNLVLIGLVFEWQCLEMGQFKQMFINLYLAEILVKFNAKSKSFI